MLLKTGTTAISRRSPLLKAPLKVSSSRSSTNAYRQNYSRSWKRQYSWRTICSKPVQQSNSKTSKQTILTRITITMFSLSTHLDKNREKYNFFTLKQLRLIKGLRLDSKFIPGESQKKRSQSAEKILKCQKGTRKMMNT